MAQDRTLDVTNRTTLEALIAPDAITELQEIILERARKCLEDSDERDDGAIGTSFSIEPHERITYKALPQGWLDEAMEDLFQELGFTYVSAEYVPAPLN